MEASWRNTPPHQTLSHYFFSAFHAVIYFDNKHTQYWGKKKRKKRTEKLGLVQEALKQTPRQESYCVNMQAVRMQTERFGFCWTLSSLFISQVYGPLIEAAWQMTELRRAYLNRHG